MKITERSGTNHYLMKHKTYSVDSNREGRLEDENTNRAVWKRRNK